MRAECPVTHIRGTSEQESRRRRSGGYWRWSRRRLERRRVAASPLRVAKRSQVRTYSLRAWLPDVQPGAGTGTFRRAESSITIELA
jgi:hypothetical protein